MGVCAAITFVDVLETIVDVEGWLSKEQARCLYNRAVALPQGSQVVEIGSFRGRSLIVLACAAPEDAQLVAIDPHAGNDRGPKEIRSNQKLGDADNRVFKANLDRAGVAHRVTHIRKTSTEASGDVNGDINLLYIDGAHRYRMARNDIVRYGNRVVTNGTMLVHDAFSSIGVTGALLTSTFTSRQWVYQGRCGSLAQYRRQPVRGSAALTNVFQQTLQLGWFLRNIFIKTALTLKLYPLTRIFGHTTRDWPY